MTGDVASDATGGGSWLGIVELGERCARLRALSLDLFEQLGAGITTAEPARQRLLAEAAHRHAWHAELWEARCPVIPSVDLEQMTADHRTNADLLADYGAVLDDLNAELDELERRIDPRIDPSTRRTIMLVRADLVDLRRRL